MQNYWVLQNYFKETLKVTILLWVTDVFSWRLSCTALSTYSLISWTTRTKKAHGENKAKNVLLVSVSLDISLSKALNPCNLYLVSFMKPKYHFLYHSAWRELDMEIFLSVLA